MMLPRTSPTWSFSRQCNCWITGRGVIIVGDVYVDGQCIGALGVEFQAMWGPKFACEVDVIVDETVH